MILTTAARKALASSDFALPGRRYPIHNEAHARNALARVSQYGTPDEQNKVRAAVHRRYPGIDKPEYKGDKKDNPSLPNEPRK